MKSVHSTPDCEIIAEDDIDLEDGIAEDEYYGQTVWDGKKLVTEKEWDWREYQGHA